MTYGDDNIMGVNPKVDWFNHTVISDVLATMGVTYTMADKTSKSVPFIDIKECSFLKRAWRWDDDLQAYVGPLDHDSIEKMLMVHVLSKTIHPEEQIIAGISSALTEYFFYGKDIYLEKLALLKKVVKESNLESFVKPTTFMSWERLKDRYEDNSETFTIELEAKPLLKMDESIYERQSLCEKLPYDVFHRILLFQIQNLSKVHPQYVYRSEVLCEYYKTSWMLGMNLWYYNRHIYLSNMYGANTYLPENTWLGRDSWRYISYPRPQPVPLYLKVIYYLWISLIVIVYYQILLYAIFIWRQIRFY